MADRNHQTPIKPTACAWDKCGKPIAPSAPVWYDRMHAILKEVTFADGTVEYRKSVGGFCTPFCMNGRRHELLEPALARSRGKPSP